MQLRSLSVSVDCVKRRMLVKWCRCGSGLWSPPLEVGRQFRVVSDVPFGSTSYVSAYCVEHHFIDFFRIVSLALHFSGTVNTSDYSQVSIRIVGKFSDTERQ
jgi:hypothetical protein